MFWFLNRYSDVEDAASLTLMNDLDQATSSQLEEKIVRSTEEMSKIVESLVPVQKIPDLCINFVKNIFDDTRDTTQYLFYFSGTFFVS